MDDPKQGTAMSQRKPLTMPTTDRIFRILNDVREELPPSFATGQDLPKAVVDEVEGYKHRDASFPLGLVLNP